MICWILNNLVGIIGIIVGSFIAYHVYFLSKKLDLKDKLTHREDIKKRVEPILAEIRKGRNSDAELINVKKYFTHYPKNNQKNKDGYTNLKGELKALTFDGIELFCGIREVYKRKDGSLTLKKEDGTTRENFNAIEAGIIPYEWIEYVDHRGDEFSYRPQFFTKFNGKDKSPYKYLVYYTESDTYHEGSDPMDMKWKIINIEK